ERTTGELMRDLRSRGLFGSDKLVLLKQLLEECDLVKFAKFRPDADESMKAHAAAVQFVEGTKDLYRHSGESPNPVPLKPGDPGSARQPDGPPDVWRFRRGDN